MPARATGCGATSSFLRVKALMLRIQLDCGFPLSALLTRQACEELDLREGNLIAALVKAPNVHPVPLLIPATDPVRIPKGDIHRAQCIRSGIAVMRRFTLYTPCTGFGDIKWRKGRDSNPR